MQGIIDIKGKPYTLISERVRLAHAERESFEMVSSGPVQVADMWVWQVVILVDGKRYIGTAEIKFDASPKTADGTNPVACAETSATGRALGMAGLGSVDSIASADEVIMAERERERKPSYNDDDPITEQQIKSINNLYKQLGETAVALDGLTFGDGRSMLKSLQERVQAKRKAS